MHFYMIPNWSYLTFVLLICIFNDLDPPAIDKNKYKIIYKKGFLEEIYGFCGSFLTVVHTSSQSQNWLLYTKPSAAGSANLHVY